MDPVPVAFSAFRPCIPAPRQAGSSRDPAPPVGQVLPAAFDALRRLVDENAMGVPEQLSDRWWLWPVFGPSRYTRWDELAGRDHIHLHGVHATTEEGLAGIMADAQIKPGHGSQGWGPSQPNGDVISCVGFQARFVNNDSDAQYNKAELLRVLARFSPHEGKHQAPGLVMIKVYGQKLRCQNNEAWFNTPGAWQMLAYFPNDRHMPGHWTVPTLLATPAAIVVDGHFC